MELLNNPVRAYAWGSRTVIAEMLGRPVPSPHPEAEMWLGAHPGDPSHLATGKSLVEAITADPDGQLGTDRAGHWDATLPFLLKVLAADEPLSLQAHPSLEQARAGFAADEAAGLARDAPERNYRDPNHKPELICALTPFAALVGFRAPADTVQLLRALDVAAIAAHVELLSAQPDASGLRALFTTWITLPQKMLDELVPAVAAAAVPLAGHGPWHVEARTVLELAERYPGDAGVLAALLLNRVTLAPGEALYLPAGNLHAYLSGAGVELMANSDNVLRGGMTPKHVDVPELLRVLDFHSGPPPVLRGDPDGDWVRYDTQAKEFLLRRCEADSGEVAVPDDGPRILLCTAGEASLRADGTELALPRGGAAWLAASDTGVTVSVRAPGTQLFVASDGLA
ncbi:MAG TPA: mannose-6-phosphate isomerase, class I [Pseudonocardia sp.]